MKIRVTPLLLVVAVCSIGIYYYMQNRQYTVTVFDAFDTVSTLNIYSAHDNTKEYEGLIKEYDKKLSAFNETSEIYKLNREKKADISPDTEELLCNAITYSSRLSDYFDISINPLCQKWDESKVSGTPPVITNEDLSAIGIEKIRVDIDKNTASITHTDASVTLGAIAKGYVTDKLVHHMKLNGDENALINLGGNIYAMGTKPGGKAWKIGIADPNNPADSAVTLEISNKAVVTSGDYERYFESDGKRYHHIIDPKTGYPSESGLRSATAIGTKAELCDILSTAMFVAGKEKAAALSKEYGIDAVLIDDENIYYTPPLEGFLSLHNEVYNLCVID